MLAGNAAEFAHNSSKIFPLRAVTCWMETNKSTLGDLPWTGTIFVTYVCPHRRHCIVFLSKTLYPPLSTGSNQDDPSHHDRKTVDWDVKDESKQTYMCTVVENSFLQLECCRLTWELSDRALDSNWRVLGLSLTGVTALCPWATHFIPCLVLVQPRETHPDMTEKLLTGT